MDANKREGELGFMAAKYAKYANGNENGFAEMTVVNGLSSRLIAEKCQK
jgi:hypothetical protein